MKRSIFLAAARETWATLSLGVAAFQQTQAARGADEKVVEVEKLPRPSVDC